MLICLCSGRCFTGGERNTSGGGGGEGTRKGSGVGKKKGLVRRGYVGRNDFSGAGGKGSTCARVLAGGETGIDYYYCCACFHARQSAMWLAVKKQCMIRCHRRKQARALTADVITTRLSRARADQTRPALLQNRSAYVYFHFFIRTKKTRGDTMRVQQSSTLFGPDEDPKNITILRTSEVKNKAGMD